MKKIILNTRYIEGDEGFRWKYDDIASAAKLLFVCRARWTLKRDCTSSAIKWGTEISYQGIRRRYRV